MEFYGLEQSNKNANMSFRHEKNPLSLGLCGLLWIYVD